MIPTDFGLRATVSVAPIPDGTSAPVLLGTVLETGTGSPPAVVAGTTGGSTLATLTAPGGGSGRRLFRAHLTGSLRVAGSGQGWRSVERATVTVTFSNPSDVASGTVTRTTSVPNTGDAVTFDAPSGFMSLTPGGSGAIRIDIAASNARGPVVLEGAQFVCIGSSTQTLRTGALVFDDAPPLQPVVYDVWGT